MKPATNKQRLSSGYKSEIKISYQKLAACLGEPHDRTQEGEWISRDGKVRAEWAFIFPEFKNAVITIYDYKEKIPVKEVTNWHIGGKGKEENIAKAINKLIEAIKKSPEGDQN